MTSKKKYHYLLKLLAFLKVPLLFSTSPKVIELNDAETTVYLPLKRKNKNHLGSMYFGALAMGAELSIALMAIRETRESAPKVNFIFKDFSAKFLKRPDQGVYFSCFQAGDIKTLVKQANQSGEREEQTFKGVAYTNLKIKEPVMEYELTLSLKKRS